MTQFLEYIKMAFANIKTNKGRSFLTMLGIIIGISSVIMVISLGNGAKNVVSDSMAGIAAGQICLYSYDETGSYLITNDDIEAIRQGVEGIKGITARDNYSGEMKTSKGRFQVNGTAVMPDYQYFDNNGILEGRFFDENEYLSGQPVAVIGEEDAIRLFGSTDVVGMDMDVTMYNVNITFKIVGVTKASSDSLITFEYENSPVTLIHPLTVYERIYGMEVDDFWQVYILSEEGANTYDITDAVSSIMERRHRCQGEDIYQYENFSDYMSMADGVINMVTIFISLVAAISLIVGGIGVMNIMLVSVTERTREIGIRKALGAKTGSVMVQFLSESAIITLLGGIIGIIVGISGAYMASGVVGMVKPSLGFTPDISLPAIIIATLFSSIIGIFFGIYPAKKAAKLNPIEALRR